MAHSSFLFYYSNRRLSGSFRSFFFIPTALALITSIFILFYISTTSNLFTHTHQITVRLKPPHVSSTLSPPARQTISFSFQNASQRPFESPKIAHLGERSGEAGIESQRPLGMSSLVFLILGLAFLWFLLMSWWVFGLLFYSSVYCIVMGNYESCSFWEVKNRYCKVRQKLALGF